MSYASNQNNPVATNGYHTDSYDNSIVIDGFENGIADSEFGGISNLRNVNITSVPGEASVNFALGAMGKPPTVSAAAFTVETTDIFTVSSTSGWYNGMAITLNSLSGGTGLSTGRVYWVGDLSGATFKVYTSPSIAAGRSPVNVTVAGSGTLTSYTLTAAPQYFYSGPGFPQSLICTFMIDGNGYVWWLNNNYSDATRGTYTGNLSFMGNTTLTGATGQGICVYEGYLFAFRGTYIDYLKVSKIMDGSSDVYSSWVYDWESGTLDGWEINMALSATDRAMYICNGHSIASVLKIPGVTFDPATATTYTINGDALILPLYEIALCLAQASNGDLLVGGTFNFIYPWNKVDPGYQDPILIADTVIRRMITVNTNTYVLAGNRGRVYITNGNQAQLFKKLPDHISGTVTPYYAWGDLSYLRNQLLLSVKASTNGGTAIPEYGGVWSIDLDTGAILLEHRLSYGSYAGTATAITPMYPFPRYAYASTASTQPLGNGVFAGWDSGSSTYGVDWSLGTPSTDGSATVDSPLIPIGTFLKPRDANRISFRLTKPLVSGESVTIRQRLIFNTSATGWTDVFTCSTAGLYSDDAPTNFRNAQWVQLQAALTSTATNPSYVRLRELRITGIV